MSESMVERVAKAICAVSFIPDQGGPAVRYDPNGFIPPNKIWINDEWNAEPYPVWRLFEEQARAAIEAMRTLPKDVTDAIYSAGESTFEYDNVGDEFIGKIWAAGIDAALKD